MSELIEKISVLLKEGKGSLNLDEYKMSVEIPDEVHVEIEFEADESAQKLEIELEWGKIGKEIEESEEITSDIGEAEPVEQIESKPEMDEDITEEVADEKSKIEAEDLGFSNQLTEETVEEDIDADNKMREILQQLTVQMQEASKTEEEAAIKEPEMPEQQEVEPTEVVEDFKPDGNIFEIPEETEKPSIEEDEKEPSEFSSIEYEEEKVESEEKEIPVYEPEVESEITEEAKPEEKEDISETLIKKAETEELGSTDDLQKILDALKKTKLNDDEE